MTLDTQTFGITRHWLSVALSTIPVEPSLFAGKSLSQSRKTFLAGKNQLNAIKNWLSNSGVLEIQRGQAKLTDLGRLMAAQDDRAQKAWTWWLFHLHLCASSGAFPYSTFFWWFDPEGKAWWSFDKIVDQLFGPCQEQLNIEQSAARNSVKTYFEGVEHTFCPNHPLYSLGLVERRAIPGEDGKERIRRRVVNPPEIVVAYATLLYHSACFSGQSTVDATELLDQGLGHALGMRPSDVRDSLLRIHQDAQLSDFLQYTQTANLDSVQFLKSGSQPLRQIRAHAYQSNEVQWP